MSFRFMLHLVVWMGWILLGCFIVSAVLELRNPAEASEPEPVLKWALPITGIVGLLCGLGALHIRHHLFWVRRKINIDDGAGRAVFLGCTIAAMTGAGLSSFAWFATRVVWGSTTFPMVGVLVGILFLTLLFPKLPK